MEKQIREFMAGEIGKGTSLSDLQTLVNEKFGKKYTFMDIRILASELESIDWTAQDPKKPEPKPEAAADGAEDPAAAAPVPGDGKTVVEVSKLIRPGAALSGSVKFASGASAEWFVDNMGRLGLDKVVGEPNENDLKAFQVELQKIFARG